jgi:hypothetical protein
MGGFYIIIFTLCLEYTQHKQDLTAGPQQINLPVLPLRHQGRRYGWSDFMFDIKFYI